MNHDPFSPRVVPADHELQNLRARALHPRIRRPFQRLTRLRAWRHTLPAAVRRLPRRYTLHLMVVVFALIALGIGRRTLTPHPEDTAAQSMAPTAPGTTDAPHRPFVGAVTSTDPTVLPDDPDALALAQWDLPASALSSRNEESPPAPLPPALPVEPSVAITAEKANLRTGPGTVFDKLAVLVQNDTVTVLARHTEWLQVRTDAHDTAWIAADLVALPAETLEELPVAQDVPAPPPPLIAETQEANLNLRDGPGTQYIGMQKLPAGTALDLLVRYGDWFRVQTADGAIGWVTGDYLAMADGVAARVPVTESIPSANPSLDGAVTETGVHLRTGPDKRYESLGTLKSGAPLTILARAADWYKVTTARGTTGWISADFVEASAFIKRRIPTTTDIPALPKPKPAPTKPKPDAAPAPAKPKPAPAPIVQPAGDAGSIAAFAAQFSGYPYVWGAAGPNAFDCSGFTQYVYKQFGLSLPHSAEMQYSGRYGTFISGKDNLAPGDLVFFANTYKRGISHVGIYIGNGNVVQAMSPSLGVGVASIYGPYWSERYYGAVRP